MRTWWQPGLIAPALLVLAGSLTEFVGTSLSAGAEDPHGGEAKVSSGGLVTNGGEPASKYDCASNVNTVAFTGAFGTASEIGWEGNQQGVVTCLGGTCVVQSGVNRQYGFGIFEAGPPSQAKGARSLPNICGPVGALMSEYLATSWRAQMIERSGRERGARANVPD